MIEIQIMQEQYAAAETVEKRVEILWSWISTNITLAKFAAGYRESESQRVLAWKSDADCPAWRMDRIKAVFDWGDLAWMTYYQVKAQIEAGDVPPLPDLPPCPVTFRQLLTENVVQ